MKILITTPFFSNLGGSELETIHTANAFASIEEVKNIDLFVHGDFDIHFLENIFIHPKIKFIRFPFFFKNRIIRGVDKRLKSIFNLQLSPIESFYWRIKYMSNYKRVYIITKSTLSYYLPIIKFFYRKEKIVVKYTTIFFKSIPKYNIDFLAKVKNNLVTSEKQQLFFREKLNLKNTGIKEVILFDEQYVLSKSRTIYDKSLFDFGILGRFSPEKQFEDTVLLIDNLRSKGYFKTLLIRGAGQRDYYENILRIIEEKELEGQITIEFQSVSYDKVFDFFDRINCFLITSKYEGGPNIGLEVMAYGLPILSYEVGAMSDRLKEFPEFIAKDSVELLEKAIDVLNYDEVVFTKKCCDLKNKYNRFYSNKIKLDYIRNFLLD